MITKRKTQQILIFCLVLFLANIITNDAVATTQQQLSISGRVLDTNREALAGVTVIVKGTTTGTVTDINGRYSLSVPDANSVLAFSFIGFKAYEIVAGNRSVIDITLEDDFQILDEVIVTGFGNLRRSAYNGSASVIRTDALAGIPNQSVASMIQVNAPGVSVMTTSGQPGGFSDMRIRGIGSFSASSSPLFVIDGVPVMSGDINQTGRSAVGTDIMSTLNPNDIANITIIKDAAAASLWGSRAANGVVLITTRQGDRGNARISFSSDFGMSDIAYPYRPMMSGEERHQFIYDAYVRKGMYIDGLSEADARAYANAEKEKDANSVMPVWAVAPWSGWADWVSEALRKGSHNNQEISVSGGSDRMTYFSSFSRTNAKGVQKVQELDRITGRVNVTYNANRWLKLGGNLMFAETKQSLGDDRSSSYNSPTYIAFVKATPANPVYNPDGTFNHDFIGSNTRNVASVYKYDRNEQQLTRAFNTVFTELSLLPALKFRTTLSYDYTNSRGYVWEHPENRQTTSVRGQAVSSYIEYRQMIWSSNFNYVKTFGTNHNLDALVAYEISDNNINRLSSTATGFMNYDYTEIGNGSLPTSISGYYEQDRMVSYISRLNYNWNSKYYLGASFRRDGTSRLHSDSRWGNFWSVSGGWRFSDENFMAGAKSFITNGKLRVSYGVNGNRPTGLYSYLSLANISSSYNNLTAMREGNLADNQLKWENNHTLNVGLDATIKNRLNMTLEYYDRITRDLLMNLPISMTTGFGSLRTNVGSMRNRGIELTLNRSNIRTNDWSWDTQFNITHNKNEILDLGPEGEIISTSTGSSTIQRVGSPFIQYYVIEFSHINPDNGRTMYFMNNRLEDGTINRELTDDGSKASFIPYKSPYPKVTMGLSNNVRWKIIDMSFTFSSTLGGYSYDRGGDKSLTSGALDGMVNQLPTFYRDSWKQPGDNAQYEIWVPYNDRIHSVGTYNSTRRVRSTDHIRLKNVNVGVSLPRHLANTMSVQQVRVYFAAQNLWTLAKNDQYDPELVPGDRGIVGYETPPLKSWSLGINVNF